MYSQVAVFNSFSCSRATIESLHFFYRITTTTTHPLTTNTTFSRTPSPIFFSPSF